MHIVACIKISLFTIYFNKLLQFNRRFSDCHLHGEMLHTDLAWKIWDHAVGKGDQCPAEADAPAFVVVDAVVVVAVVVVAAAAAAAAAALWLVVVSVAVLITAPPGV